MTIVASGRVVHERSDDITPADLRACAAVSGEDDDSPLGIACVLALRTLIELGMLPDSAIMLGYRAVWHRAPAPGHYRTDMRIVEADGPRTRYQRVVIGYRTVSTSDHRPVFEQFQEVLWPITA